MKTNQTIILVYINDGKILLEKRPEDSAFSGHFIYPGGSIEPEEIENPTQALIRESLEELNVTPLEFKPLEQSVGETGRMLKPFVITKWEGNIPEKILDKGNPVFWVNIEEVLKSPLDSISSIAKQAINILED